ncbi:MAG: ExbD/TolR family protein [Pseudomonadales bacterium]|nr:ExbD/TolR family protein [Pseudomonadales bacterium]
MLVLLVIFMVSAPLLTQGVPVDLPQSNSNPLDMNQEEPLIVSIKADGSLYVNVSDEETAKSMQMIQDVVAKIVKAKPNTPVLVWGDAAVPYGDVVTLMAKLQEVGVIQVGLVTEPQ